MVNNLKPCFSGMCDSTTVFMDLQHYQNWIDHGRTLCITKPGQGEAQRKWERALEMMRQNWTERDYYQRRVSLDQFRRDGMVKY